MTQPVFQSSAMQEICIDSPAAHSYALDFAKEHYAIYPWIASACGLLRVLQHEHGMPMLARIHRREAHRELFVDLWAPRSLSEIELQRTQESIVFCLGLDTDYTRLYNSAKTDPILAAALRINKGIRPKRYSRVFEAACGAVCAQNVDFRRLYSMMELLCKTLGPRLVVSAEDYWGFPDPEAVAGATEAELRACKVGYRSTRLQKAGQWFAEKGDLLSREHLGNLPRDEALSLLSEVPGIGPYSAAIILATGVGRQDTFHLDSFTRQIICTMYLAGTHCTREEMRAFAEGKWPGYGASVANVLTTNTHVWAAEVGYPGFRPSYAKLGSPSRYTASKSP